MIAKLSPSRLVFNISVVNCYKLQRQGVLSGDIWWQVFTDPPLMILVVALLAPRKDIPPMTVSDKPALSQLGISSRLRLASSLLVPLAVSFFLVFYRIGVGESQADSYQINGALKLSWSQFFSDFLSNPKSVYGGFQAPLYYIIGKVYGSLVGIDVFHLRALSAFALIATVIFSWAIYPFLTENHDWRLRFLFTLLVGTAPMHIYRAQTEKYDMWLAFAYIANFATAIWFVRTKKLLQLVLLAFSMASIFYTHYFGLVFAGAEICILFIIAAVQRNKSFALKVIAVGVLYAIFIAPLLPVMTQAAILRSQEQYHFGNGSVLDPGNIGRGILLESNFGPYLKGSPDRLFGQAPQNTFDSLFAQGKFQVATAALLLVVGFLYAAVQLHLNRANQNLVIGVIILIATPLLSLVFSYAIKFAFRYEYLDCITWTTLAVLFIGWATNKHIPVTVVLSACMIALYGYSLVTYYQFLDTKYPGSQLIIQYLKDNQASIHTALIDDWITMVRGSPINPADVPIGMSLKAIASPANIPLEGSLGTVVFLGGYEWEGLKPILDAFTTQTSISWTLLNYWQTWENPAASIYVVKINYPALQNPIPMSKSQQ